MTANNANVNLNKRCPICGREIPKAITYEEHTGTAVHRAAVAKAVGR